MRIRQVRALVLVVLFSFSITTSLPAAPARDRDSGPGRDAPFIEIVIVKKLPRLRITVFGDTLTIPKP